MSWVYHGCGLYLPLPCCSCVRVKVSSITWVRRCGEDDRNWGWSEDTNGNQNHDQFIMLLYGIWVLVLQGLVGIHRTIKLQLLQHYWLGHKLGLLWSWMVCLGNEQRSFCHFWDCGQVLHFGLFVDHDGYSISSKGFLPTVVDIMVIWVKFTHSSPF